jgi:hydroxyacylglutathione hydrolase
MQAPPKCSALRANIGRTIAVSMANIPLEDSYSDIIGKAMRGLRIDEAGLAAQAGLGVEEIQSLCNGTFIPAHAQKIAPVLGLNFSALEALAEKRYLPAAIALDGLALFNTPFEDMTVNAYLIWDPVSKDAAVFDTGADASGILDEAKSRGLAIKHIFITHTHGDHIFDIDRLREKTGATVWSGDREPLDATNVFATGQSWDLGALKIETRLTWGHSPGGVTYVVSGLARPVAVVGDSIFAGSMGGGKVSYSDALKCNISEILTLPSTTVICPGHGPLTTVGEELAHNPFFAK